jgi:hypothetical protein
MTSPELPWPSSEVSLANHDLVREHLMPIGEIKHRLLGQLLGVVSAGATLEDYGIGRANDVKVADPTARTLFDIAFQLLGKSLGAPAASRPPRVHLGVKRHHASLLVFGSVKGTSVAQSMPSQWWWKGLRPETLVVGREPSCVSPFQAAGILHTFLMISTGDLAPLMFGLDFESDQTHLA